MNIPLRQDVMTRIVKSESLQIAQACDRVAKILNEATVLPIIIKMDVLGLTEMIRSKVAEKISQAGWKIMRQIDEKGWTTEYYEVG